MCIDMREVVFIFKITVYVQYILYAALMTVTDNNLFSRWLALAEKPVVTYSMMPKRLCAVTVASIEGHGFHVAGTRLSTVVPSNVAG